MSFSDHFSGHAADYAAYRPRYPEGLFDFIAGLAPRCECVWDCATGSGQAAVQLARYFGEVIATDASAQQVAEAEPHERVRYLVSPAENTPFEHNSFDLVTVAQAMHWFRFENFFTEVRRVARPDGILAAWAYDLHWVGPGIDEVLRRFYAEVVGPYWPPEREYVEQQYRTIPFPFQRLPAPPFEMRHAWTLRQLLDYMGTWSATKRYQQANGVDPRTLIEKELETIWGGMQAVHEVHWPIHLLVGRVSTFSQE